MTILISYITILMGSMLHPFHISVCEIEHDIDTKAVQISQRMFLDDLEETLNHVYGVQMDVINPENKPLRDSLIQVYVLEHLTVTVDGKDRKRTYVGHEIEKDVLWAYIEYHGVKKMERLNITNTTFFELYQDQSIIVHMKHEGVTTSRRLSQEKFNEEFLF